MKLDDLFENLELNLPFLFGAPPQPVSRDLEHAEL